MIDTTRTRGENAPPSLTSQRWAWGLPVLRVVLVALASLFVWSAFGGAAAGLAFPPPAMLASMAMLP